MTKAYDLEQQLRSSIQRLARAYVQRGGKLKVLAAESGVAQSTLSKLAHYETKHPRMSTVLGVSVALGITISYREPDAETETTVAVGGFDKANKVVNIKGRALRKPK